MNSVSNSSSPICYQVRLLGGLSIARREDGRLIPLVVPGGNAQKLLAYLLLHPQGRHPRERLGELLWPDASPDRMRRALSDLLYRLRQALREDWFVTEADTIALRTDLCLEVDCWIFEAAIKTGSLPDLERAVEQYRGELLPELYDDWLLVPRVAFHESYLDALQTLAEDAENRRALGRALIYYRQLAQADPLREEGHRGMMRVLAGQGRLREALAIYESLATHLQRELDAPPSQATQRLARQLRAELDARRQPSAPSEPFFVGRRRERAALLRAVDALTAGRGGVIAVEGEAGMGKSHLLQTIAESARWRGITVATGQASELPADAPLAPLQQIVTQALAPPRTAQLAEPLTTQERSALAPLFAGWADPQQEDVDLPADRALDRFHTAAQSLFLCLGRIAPHLLILDDAHWAEPAAWDLLATVAPALPQNRLLLLLAYRRGALQQGPGWSLLRQWEAEGLARVVVLPPLAVDEVAQMLPAHLQSQAEEIRAATGGNPFYVHEFLLNAGDEVVAPQQTVAQRARKLDPGAWAALEAAAVIGEYVPYRHWKAMVARPNEELDAMGQLLVRRVLLRPTADGYAFVHALIQQAIYQQIPAARRRQLHRQMAEHLAADPEASLRLRALHLERAGDDAAAATLYRQAGQQAMQTYAHAEAQSALERALALQPTEDAEQRAQMLLDLAAACEITGDRTRQKSALDDAKGLAERLNDDALTVQVLVQLGNWAARTGEHESARGYLDRALVLARRIDDAEQELAVELILGDLLWRSGDPRTARTHLETALALAQRLDDPVAEGRALEGIAWTAGQTEEDQQKAFVYYERALAVQRACGDRLGEARTLLNMFSSYQNIGAWDRLYALAGEVIAAQRQVSYRLGEAVAHQSLGLAAYALGDYEQAEAEVNAARRGFEQVGERLGVLITTDTLGLIAQRRGDVGQAEEILRTALEMASSLDSHFRAFVQQDLGILYYEQARYAESIDLLRCAIENWRSSGERLNPLKCEAVQGLALLAQGRRDEAEMLTARGWQAFADGTIGGEEIQFWYWMLARLHRALGRDPEADALLDAAYAELLRQAGALADPAVRRRFFADVPLNAAIVAARDQRTGTVRRQTVTLARADAPLGKALSPEEEVTLAWTVHAPEDDLVEDRVERRRAALVRLTCEAAAHGAAPTDQDLAHALGVSRRTILRDINALAAEGVHLPTRARR